MGRIASSLADGDSMLLPARIPESEDVRRPFRLKRNANWKRKLLRLPPQKRQKARQSTLKRSPLKRESKGLKAERAKYWKLSAVFLAQPENTWCICCTLRREKLGENILRNQSTEVHHFAGRIGRLLCYVPFFRAFCKPCRSWPHDHPSQARELNLLAPPALWNHFPVDGN